ncbi:MAG: hypothetical protein H7838_05030 [Magnetococcus sp. DMHC-8]
MKNFIRGAVLGGMLGMALLWYGGMADYFPAIVALIILVGVLIPLESQERRLERVLTIVEGLQNRLEQSEGVSPSIRELHDARMEEGPAFIPSIQTETQTGSPTRQKKRTVDRSLEDVARKLSSMQGG